VFSGGVCVWERDRPGRSAARLARQFPWGWWQLTFRLFRLRAAELCLSIGSKSYLSQHTIFMRPRPISITVFGILNIGFALFGFLGVFVSHLMLHAKLRAPHGMVIPTAEINPAWASFVSFFGTAQSLMLLAAGIGLLLTQHWARVLSVVYAVIAVVYAFVGSVINFPTLQATLSRMPVRIPPEAVSAVAVAATVLGLIIGLIYPGLLLYFMTRPKVVAAFEPEPPMAPPLPPST